MSAQQSEQQLGKDLEGAKDEVCASCGIAEMDDIKLKLCDGGCDLVKYCSDGCEGNHREKHEEECKKRKAKLHDKQLFTQPDSSHLGECPICCLPMPIDQNKSVFMGCCCKLICKGCDYVNTEREIEQGLVQRCVYCREPAPELLEEHYKNIMKRIKKKDPVAMTKMGKKHHGEGDYGKAFEYWTKAADLGDVQAHFCSGMLYYNGEGVEKDMKRAVYHYEQAAIGGHPGARFILAYYEKKNNRPDRATKHFMINANLGCDESLKYVKKLFVKGIASKEDYASALRGHQAAVDATKSAEREEAEAYKARD